MVVQIKESERGNENQERRCVVCNDQESEGDIDRVAKELGKHTSKKLINTVDIVGKSIDNTAKWCGFKKDMGERMTLMSIR